MSFSIELTDNFKKEAKTLAKKYASLKTELAELFKELEQTPTMGVPLGGGIYKIRLAIASKGRGKSGGARVMTYVKVTNNVVLVFSIYDKADKDAITNAEIKALLQEYR